MSRAPVFHNSQVGLQLCPRLVQYTAHTTVLEALQEGIFWRGLCYFLLICFGGRILK